MKAINPLFQTGVSRSEAFSDETTRGNLWRIGWFLVVVIVLNIAIVLTGALMPQSHRVVMPDASLTGDIVTSATLLAASWLLRRWPVPLSLRRGFVLFFLVIQLVTADAYFFNLLPHAGQTLVYSINIVCMGVILLVPPWLFQSFLIANHIVYSVLVFHSQIPDPAQTSAFIDGSVSVVLSCVAQFLLFTTQHNDFLHRRMLTRQSEEMNELMTIAAHDLRSPLNGLRSVYEMTLNREAWLREPYKEVAEQSLRVCVDALSLVNRMIEAHTLDGPGPIAMARERLDLLPQIESAVNIARPLASAKNIHLLIKSPGSAEAEINAEALGNVLGNLLSNAIKFSPDGSTVTAQLLSEEGKWCIEIHDEGPGISELDAGTLFQKFQRGSNKPTGGEISTGLGLFIARRLMEAMHGSLEYRRRRQGGSIFHIRFHD